jgi:hypothetical protein
VVYFLNGSQKNVFKTNSETLHSLECKNRGNLIPGEKDGESKFCKVDCANTFPNWKFNIV